MIKLSELKHLPFVTLKVLAVAVSRDIDNGADSHHILEAIFRAIVQCPMI